MKAAPPDYESLLTALSDTNPHPADGVPAAPAAAPTPADDALLDAYSAAVIRVVEQASPAVIAVSGPRDARGPSGSGSGVLLTPDGYALTNSHVVAGRSRLSATTHDGDTLDAALIGDDPATDLALLRIAARDLPTAPLGDSDRLRVGQLVVAMGSPFGLQATVSSGIGGRLIDGVVQHTAPINPGNSGGPLLDTRGRVVGVNTAMIAFAQGVGFAVPSNTARWVLTELISHGRVRRAVLGIAAGTAPIPRRLARQLDVLNESGVSVQSIEPDSPAASAGLRAGDIIVALDGRLVSNVDDLHRLLSRTTAAAPLTATVLRGARRLELSVVPRRGE